MLAEVRAGPGASGEDRPAPGRGLQCGPPKGPGTGLEMPDQLNSDLVKVSAPGAAPEPREPRDDEWQYESEDVGAGPKQEKHLRLRLQRLLLPLSLGSRARVRSLRHACPLPGVLEGEQVLKEE